MLSRPRHFLIHSIILMSFEARGFMRLYALYGIVELQLIQFIRNFHDREIEKIV